MLVKNDDRPSSIAAWECAVGGFNWHYSKDGGVIVISGEVFVTTENGEERRLGRGDVGFFPAGGSCTRRINDRVKGWRPPKGPTALAGYWRASLAQAPPRPRAKRPVIRNVASLDPARMQF